MRKKVVVAGHICIDITPAIQKRSSEGLQDLLCPGKLVNVGEADIHTGGAVANTGLAMKHLGVDVTLAGKIGDDPFGENILRIMHRHGAEDGLIRDGKSSTSYSVVIAVPGEDRIFLHHPGANDTFCADDLSEKTLSETTLFHFGYPPLMRRMYEQNGAELVKILKKARKHGAAVSLDLAGVDPLSPAGKADWDAILSAVLPLTDFFVPSIEELLYMLDRKRYEELQKEAGQRDICTLISPDRDVMPLAQVCIDRGAKVVLIKCGAKGMYLKTAPKQLLKEMSVRTGTDADAWADDSHFEKSFVPEKILSATGAGDTSIATFLTAMLAKYTPKECVRFAAAQGAMCVSAYDALSGLLGLDELKKRIDAGWEKVE